MENKEHITSRLFSCLLLTRAGSDIADMTYHRAKYDEWVNVTFKDGGCMHINVAADSGIALIKDVIKALT